MKFTEQKESLLERCEQLLKCVYKKDIGWLNGEEDVLDDKYIIELLNWHKDADYFIREFGTNRTKDDFKTIPAITDGQRVSVERINEILSIIERIKV